MREVEKYFDLRERERERERERGGGPGDYGNLIFLYIKSGNAATVLWHCALSVFALCKHCSGNSALVSPLFFFFFNPIV